MISYPLERKAIKYESKATASNMAKALAVLVLLESLIVIGLIWLLETADTTTISILVVITLLPLTIAWMLWFHQLKVQVLDNGILLSGTKPLFGFKNRFVPFADI